MQSCLSNFTLLAVAIYCLTFVESACAITIYSEDGSIGSNTVGNNLTINSVADPTLDDGAGDVAIEASDLTAKFSSVASGAVPVPAGAIGNAFSISIDYYVPSSTNLDADDLIYLQVNLNGSNRGSVGFVNPLDSTDSWNNFTLTKLEFPRRRSYQWT